MSTLSIQEEAVSYSILELCRFNHLIDPNSRTIFGWNVYQLFSISINLIIQILTTIGCFGILVNRDYSINYTNYFLYVYSTIYVFFNFWKISVIFKNSIILWEVFDITKIIFFKSKCCCKNIRALYEYRKITMKIANYFLIFTFTLTCVWLICPLLVTSFMPFDTFNNRVPNIINYPFPVQIKTYNQYYIVFYVVELLIMSITVYNVVTVFTFFIVISQVIVAYYKVIAQSYRDIGYEDKTQTGKTNQTNCRHNIIVLQGR